MSKIGRVTKESKRPLNIFQGLPLEVWKSRFPESKSPLAILTSKYDVEGLEYYLKDSKLGTEEPGIMLAFQNAIVAASGNRHKMLELLSKKYLNNTNIANAVWNELIVLFLSAMNNKYNDQILIADSVFAELLRIILNTPLTEDRLKQIEQLKALLKVSRPKTGRLPQFYEEDDYKENFKRNWYTWDESYEVLTDLPKQDEKNIVKKVINNIGNFLASFKKQ
jgi:hypothetical protein